MLKVVRNCIAHGRFAIVGDTLIGFDGHTLKKEPVLRKNGIIKIKPKKLVNALKKLSSPRAKETLVGFAFSRLGYTVHPMDRIALSSGKMLMFDLLLEKDGRKYAIEIKSYRGRRYLHLDDLMPFLSASECLDDVERVLFIDTSRVTREVRQYEQQLDNFRIIDLSQIKLMLEEDPIDILNQNE